MGVECSVPKTVGNLTSLPYPYTYQEHLLPREFITVDVDLDQTAEVVFSRFLHVKLLFFFPFHTELFETKSLCAAHTLVKK